MDSGNVGGGCHLHRAFRQVLLWTDEAGMGHFKRTNEECDGYKGRGTQHKSFIKCTKQHLYQNSKYSLWILLLCHKLSCSDSVCPQQYMSETLLISWDKKQIMTKVYSYLAYFLQAFYTHIYWLSGRQLSDWRFITATTFNVHFPMPLFNHNGMKHPLWKCLTSARFTLLKLFCCGQKVESGTARFFMAAYGMMQQWLLLNCQVAMLIW